MSRPAGRTASSSRAARTGARVALAALVGAVAGCTGAEPTPAPTAARTPRPADLAAGDTRARNGDYWLETLGDYLGPDYRRAPEGERFARFGARLLEFRLREDLLRDQRWALSQADIDGFCDQPGFDDSQAYLQRVLGAEPR